MLLTLALWACTSAPPSAESVARGVPEGWIWVSSARGYEVAFPGFPTRVDRPERVELPDGSRMDVTISRAELVRADGGFVVAVTPQAPDGIERAGGPTVVTSSMAAHVARSLGGQLADPGPWEGVPGGTTARIAVPTGRYAEVRVATGPERVVFAQANSTSHEAVRQFVDSFRPLEAVQPVEVAIGPIGRAACPARCGPFSDRARVGAEVRPLTGFRGMLDQDRFEGVWTEVPEGTDPTAAMEQLRDRFVNRLDGHVLEERPDPLGEHPGWRTRYQARRAVGEIRTVMVGRTVIAIEAHAPLGTLPAWVEPYLGSIAVR